MRAKTITYFFEEGAKGFWVNGLMSVASVFIVVASLLILGIYVAFSLNINYIGTQFEQQYEIRAFIESGTSEERLNQIKDEISKIKHVKNAEIVTAGQAFEDYKGTLGGDSDILDGLKDGDNPLRDAVKITLSDLNSANAVAKTVSEIPNVAKVRNSQDVVQSLLKLTAAIRHGSMILMILLSVVAVFIISNAIRMTVFARRRDIGIAKFLGATDWFIRWPFIIEGVIMGVVGALIALALVVPGYNYIYTSLNNMAGNAVKFYTTDVIVKEISVWFVGIGALLGAFGSGISLGRYLHV